MLNKLSSWVLSHKLTTVLLLIVIWLVWSNLRPNLLGSRYATNSGIGGLSLEKASAPTMYTAPAPAEFTTGETVDAATANSDYRASVGAERMVIQSSDLSLQVKDAPVARDNVVAKAEELGGWMVSSSLNRPEESPFAHVTISVPSDKMGQALEYFRSLSIKVVSENLLGRDVTDQYTDLEEHISILEKTKARYDEIRAQAVKIDDLLTVTRELTNIQNQIDSYQGRMQKLENDVTMSQISVYLATDEMALPYAPDQVFRPSVIFKLAVRSLVSTFYGLATKAIWIGVFAIIWVPVLLIIRWFYKRNGLRR